MKKIISVLTVGVLLLFSGCKSKPKAIELNPPFFKVTDESTGAVVYMLGSMHIGKPDAVYSEELYAALDECDTLAVEVDIQELENNMLEAAQAMSVMLCPFGTSVKNYMGEDYDKVIEKFREKGLYNFAYEQYIPDLWSSLWTNQAAIDCGYDTSCGTDLLMLTYAKEHGKKIDEIETAKEQYQISADTPAEFQMYSLNATLDLTQEEMQEQFDTLYNAWGSGDIEALKALAEEEEGEELTPQIKEYYEKYYDMMYTARQRKMADYVENKLKSGGKTFVVVGAMHYAAPPSILDNLAEDGYTVETLTK